MEATEMSSELQAGSHDNSAMPSGKTQKAAAKSAVTLDIKPWDDTTSMPDLEKAVRAIEADGLLWGASRLVPIGFGVRKLQINLVVEDEKVSVTELQEQIEELDDFVQSSDVVAMMKL